MTCAEGIVQSTVLVTEKKKVILFLYTATILHEKSVRHRIIRYWIPIRNLQDKESKERSSSFNILVGKDSSYTFFTESSPFSVVKRPYFVRCLFITVDPNNTNSRILDDIIT